MATTVRAATRRDVPAILALEHDCFDRHRFTRAQFEHYFYRPGSIFLVAESAGAVCGYVLGLADHRRTDRATRMYSIAVSAQARRSGLGSLLVEAFENAARQLGSGAVILEVACGNDAALSLYGRFGYTPLGPLPHYYGRSRHGLAMLKQLRGGPA